MAKVDQLTKGMNREAENDQVFLADSPHSPDSGRRLYGHGAVSNTRFAQCDANPTDGYISAANLDGHTSLHGHANRYSGPGAACQR